MENYHKAFAILIGNQDNCFIIHLLDDEDFFVNTLFLLHVIIFFNIETKRYNMFEKQIQKTIQILRNAEIPLEEGLTNVEMEKAQTFYQIRFPSDLAELLSTVCPASKKFVDWRDFSKQNIERMKTALNWPIEGTLFDVEHNDFWMKSWGEKPESMKDMLKLARKNLKKMPKLIPLYGHRYLPSDPLEAGNPVLSVYQTDIIYYGHDLWNYFQHEFGKQKIQYDRITRKIPFWSEILDQTD